MHLPNELIIHVLENLDYLNLLSCMQVSTNFRDLIDRTASLQYIIELAASGQKDGHFHPLASSGEKLNLLRKHQAAWRNVTWSREVKISMEDGGLWELFGGVLGQTNEMNELTFHRLPSDIRGIEEKSWTLGSDLGCTVDDFAMDPYQDLLVIAEGPGTNANGELNGEYHVHLRSLTTGKPHPIATTPMLILFQRGEVIDTEISYTIQIFGDLVATLFSPEFIYENQVAVWEWKTGRLLLNVFGEDLDSFSLLSQQHVIFALCDGHGDPMLLAANLAKETSDCQEFCKVKSGKYFRYPALGEDSYLHSLQLRADPGPLCGENQNVPFYQDTKDFILILNMWITEDEIAKHLIHFIPSQLLLSLIESESRVTSDWWLSRDTRMYLARDQNDTHVWVCYVFGTRFVTSAYPLTHARGKGEMTIALYDFNRLALRRGAQTSAASDMPGSVVLLSNQIHSGHPFCEDAETSLPYWTNVAYVDAGKNYDGHCTMMCCEDNIVIVDLESRMYRVLVF